MYNESITRRKIMKSYTPIKTMTRGNDMESFFLKSGKYIVSVVLKETSENWLYVMDKTEYLDWIEENEINGWK